MSNGFKDREKGFETKYQHDQEMLFKITARRNGWRTVVMPTAASPRSSVTPKKNRKAETAMFMQAAEAPWVRM